MSAGRRKLENRFNDFILAGIPGLREAGYNPARFMEMVKSIGSPLAATWVLLDDPRNTHDGFQRLYHMRRLDASVEYAACLPWFEELFTQAQLYKARTRLITHDFDLDRRIASTVADPPSWVVDLETTEDGDDS